MKCPKCFIFWYDDSDDQFICPDCDNEDADGIDGLQLGYDYIDEIGGTYTTDNTQETQP